jgi:hypothetical protein
VTEALATTTGAGTATACWEGEGEGEGGAGAAVGMVVSEAGELAAGAISVGRTGTSTVEVRERNTRNAPTMTTAPSAPATTLRWREPRLRGAERAVVPHDASVRA